MDLSTQYLGLELKHPFMPGASPMVDDLDTVKELEDAGASAIVMHSLFEEQISRERFDTAMALEMHSESFAEALSYFPVLDEFALGPDEYLNQLRRIKETVAVPVIASLNGTTPAGWLEYGKLMQDAGADALELNIYYLPTETWESADDIDHRIGAIIDTVRKGTTLPIALKLSPFHSSLPHLAKRADARGANGLVLFNRFYQPDIDVEALEAVPSLQLSHSSELLLRLRWLAILDEQTRCSLAVSGGVHSAIDAVKAIMAGASAVQMVSALLTHGPAHLARVIEDTVLWLEQHEYESLRQMRGSMSLKHCPDRGAFERANYMRILQSWRPT